MCTAVELAVSKSELIQCAHLSISSYSVVFPHPVATGIPQPAVIQDMEPETTCKLAILCG